MRTVAGLLAAAAFCLSAPATAQSPEDSASKPEARAAFGAILRIPFAGVEFRPRAYVLNASRDWVAKEASDGVQQDAEGKRSFYIKTTGGSGSEVRGFCRYADTAAGVAAEWTAVPGAASRAVGLELRGVLPLEDYAAGSFVADGTRRPIPYEDVKGGVFKGDVRSFVLFDRSGAERLSLTFAAPQRLAIERSGDPKIGGRLILCLRMSDAPKPGVACSVAFTASVPGGLKVGPDGTCRISAGPDWIPFKNCGGIRAGSALDFSALRPTGEPAGRFGRIVARGGHFELEGRPGVPVRINGLTLGVSEIIRPARSLEEVRTIAETLADRYARSGYNAVLLMNYGYGVLHGSGDCTRPNPKQMEKYDALVAAFVRRGLYLSTYLEDDRFWLQPWRSCGVDRDGNLSGGEWKRLVQVHEGVQSNTMAFARNFFGHRNVYTGRTLAEEPALGWISLTGEGCLGANTAALERHEAWRTAWRVFLAERRAADPANWKDIPETFPKSVSEPTRHATAFKLFLDACEARFGARMKRLLRDELKCRALVSSMNGVFYQNHIRRSRVETYDYVDGHFYVDHPDFLGLDWKLPATAGVSSPVCNALGIHGPWLDREFGKPFVVTEFNYCPPNPCRGIAGLFAGAQAAFQDWSGVWRFATCGSAEEILHPETAKMSSFNMTGDPLFRASQVATALLYLRGDMAVGRRAFAREIPDGVFAKPTDDAPGEDVWHWLNWTAWYGRVGSWSGHPAGALPSGVESLCRYPESYRTKSLETVRRLVAGCGAKDPLPTAADGAAQLDAARGSLFLTTPRTCGGFVTRGSLTAGPLAADRLETPTAVWTSSLDGRPVASSRHLLLFHLVDCVNTDIVFSDDSRRVLLDWGRAPQLVRRTKAHVTLAAGEGAWTVWALHEDGERRFAVPTRVEDGRLAFEADTAGEDGSAVLCYELVRP